MRKFGVSKEASLAFDFSGRNLSLDDKIKTSHESTSLEPGSRLLPVQKEGSSPPKKGSNGASLPSEPIQSSDPEVLRVSELGRRLRSAIESDFSRSVYVEGEVSGVRFAASGHAYFTLKDEKEDASIDVVVFRTSLTSQSQAILVHGAKVRLRGKPSYYAPRGKISFNAEKVEPAGKGTLLLALEKLKAKLQSEGLFDREKKRSLPSSPRIVGVVTSRSGAVIHDIRNVAFRRGSAHILLSPAQVQGPTAAASMISAIDLLLKVKDVDIIIVGRGGGSSDDLMCFNDESLVRKIASSPVPVISAVGHEVDTTLVDHVADVRAATPSQAAELAFPDEHARMKLLLERRARLMKNMQARIDHDLVSLSRLEKKIRDPRILIHSLQLRLDDHHLKLEQHVQQVVSRRRDFLNKLDMRLAKEHPKANLAKKSASLQAVQVRLSVLCKHIFHIHREKLQNSALSLDKLSPLRVLSRGYALVTAGGHVMSSVSQITVGQELEIKLVDGCVFASATKTEIRHEKK